MSSAEFVGVGVAVDVNGVNGVGFGDESLSQAVREATVRVRTAAATARLGMGSSASDRLPSV
jgi:hypothetical protein